MKLLSIFAFIIFSAFIVGAYSHYAADSFGLTCCLREHAQRITKSAIEVVRASNVARMVKLEKAMRKAGKGSGVHYMLSAEWKELRSYNIALGSI